MSKYIPFTEEQKRRANEVDLEDFLRCQGEKLIPSGREKRLESDHSVTIRGNEWCDHAEESQGSGKRLGGYAISFVQYHYNLSYPEAVSLLLGGEQGRGYQPAPPQPREPTKPFEPPPDAPNMRRVFAYLIKSRGISRDILLPFVRAGLLYEDAQYHNAVFVGTDGQGVPRHAHKRSTNTMGKSFRQTVEGSDARCAFHWSGTSERLYAFEAPIDLLSFLTLYPQDWQRHSYVASCGTSSLPVLKMLELVPQIIAVGLCYDNDKAGESAARNVEQLLDERGIVSGRLCPTHKDWNDDLTAQQAPPVQAMQMM